MLPPNNTLLWTMLDVSLLESTNSRSAVLQSFLSTLTWSAEASWLFVSSPAFATSSSAARLNLRKRRRRRRSLSCYYIYRHYCWMAITTAVCCYLVPSSARTVNAWTAASRNRSKIRGNAIIGIHEELAAPDKRSKRVCGSKGCAESTTPGSMSNNWASGMDKNGET